MLDQLLGSRCLQPNAVFVSAIYSTIYMKNGKVVYQITRESLNVVLLSPSSALFKSPPSPPMRFSPQVQPYHGTRTVRENRLKRNRWRGIEIEQ